MEASREENLDGQARSVLRSVWGHDDFRTGQAQVIRAVLERRDVLAVLPTGTGKSVCYQLPAQMLPGTAVVVSPLIALMQDQVASLVRKGIAAGAATSAQTAAEARNLRDRLLGRELKLLYLSPETLRKDTFLSLLNQIQISFLAVDEAHCVSEWGASFRPSYLQIRAARDALGRPPLAALTATATPRLRRELVRRLGLNRPVCIVTGFDRPNIVWSIVKTRNKAKVVRTILSRTSGSGIIYVSTRRATESWRRRLDEWGVEAVAYHGGMSKTERDRAQRTWMHNTAAFMTATCAFGMGIDKPDVRVVVHADLPPGLSAYYQEAGRAGRDGARSHAILVFSDTDVLTRQKFLAARNRTHRRSVRVERARLRAMVKYATSTECRRRYLLTHFGEIAASRCGSCDVCLGRHQTVTLTGAAGAAAIVVLGMIARERRVLGISVGKFRTDDLLTRLLDEGFVRTGRIDTGIFGLTTRGWNALRDQADVQN